MKMVKSLILGSAAGLVAMSGAQAADLPVKAAPVEYVKICSLYGAGFFYIPGTDTCIKLGGYLRVDTTFNGSIYDQPAWSGDLGQQNRYRDYFAARSRMALTVDTRTATEYGVVRTFAQADFQFTTFNSNSLNPSAFITNAVGNGLSGLLGNVGEGYVAVEFVFLQFAGFTFGKSASAYATPWHGYPGNNSSFLLGGHTTVTGINNIQYTWQFGNGVSATLGVEDSVAFERTNIANLGFNTAANPFANALSAVGGAPTGGYGGDHVPDIAGNIRVDQAWGLWQLSAASHVNNASYNSLTPGIVGGFVVPNNGSELSGHPTDKWGWAVMTALQIKNIPFGAGDDIKMDASYSKGMTKQVIATDSGSPSFAMFGGGSRLFVGNGGALLPSFGSVGFGTTTDAVFMPAFVPGFGFTGGTGDLKLTTAYGFRGAYNHNWDPYWSSSLFGSWSAVRYGGNEFDLTTAKGQYCLAYRRANGLVLGVNTSIDYSCNPNFDVSQLGFVTRWTPVKNLTFSAEVMLFHLNQNFSGAATLTPAAPKPIQVYEFKDQNTVALNVRVQRNF
jgi:Porin subfamily